MQRYFFSHIINLQILHIELQTLELSDEEKTELLNIAHDALHFAIVDAILSELSHEDKKVFLRQMTMSDHPTLWRFLNKKVSGIEKKVQEVADDFVREFHKDIQEAKKKENNQ